MFATKTPGVNSGTKSYLKCHKVVYNQRKIHIPTMMSFCLSFYYYTNTFNICVYQYFYYRFILTVVVSRHEITLAFGCFVLLLVSHTLLLLYPNSPHSGMYTICVRLIFRFTLCIKLKLIQIITSGVHSGTKSYVKCHKVVYNQRKIHIPTMMSFLSVLFSMSIDSYNSFIPFHT
jgi:hypothetical protein